MERQFLFIIMDQSSHRFEKEDSNDSSEALYCHPSSNAKFLELRDAVLTLHDLAKTVKTVKTFRKDQTEKLYSFLTMQVEEELVKFSVLEDTVAELIFVLGFSFENVSLLNALRQVFNFISEDMRKDLLDANFRSDLDGLLISAVHLAVSPVRLGTEDPVLFSGEDQPLNNNLLDVLLVELEAGDLFDQEKLDTVSGNVFVVGSCLFLNETIFINHLPDGLLKDVCLFMRLHRKGFRRVKRGGGATVMQYYTTSDRTSAESDNFLVWTSKDGVLLAVCVELCSPRDNKDTAALLDITVRGTIVALDRLAAILPPSPTRSGSHPNVVGGVSSHHSPPRTLAPSATRTSVASGTHTSVASGTRTSVASGTRTSVASGTHTSVASGTRTSVTPDTRTSVASGTRTSVASLSESSSFSTKKPSKSSKTPSMFSKTVTTFSSKFDAEKLQSKVIYRLKIFLDTGIFQQETSLEDSHKTTLVPPTLLDDFLKHASKMHTELKNNGDRVEEIAVMVEYPAPALTRKYWITGWRLLQPCREVFVCYPDGVDCDALLTVMTS